MKIPNIRNLQEGLLIGRPIWDVELTTRCNKSCYMCPRGGLVRKKQDMDIARFERFVDWLERPVDIVFAGFGEPTIHPDYLAAIAYAAAKGHGTSLMTNGKNLSSESIAAMFAAGLQKLQVSILYPQEQHRLPQLREWSADLRPDHFQLNLICEAPETIDDEDLKTLQTDGRNFMLKRVHNKAGLVSDVPNPIQGSCGTFFLVTYLNTDGDFHICSNDINGLHRLGNFEQVTYQELIDLKRAYFGNRTIATLCLSCTDEYRFKHFQKSGDVVDY